MEEIFKIYRVNYVGKIVECGSIKINKQNYVFSFHKNIKKKYEIPNFPDYLKSYNLEEIKSFVNIKSDKYFLKEFPRKKRKIKKEKYKRNLNNDLNQNKIKIVKKISEEVKKIKELEKKRKIEQDKKTKQIKNNIISNSKNKIKLKVDIFEGSKGLGTFSDMFPEQYKTKEFKEEEYYENKTKEYDVRFESTDNSIIKKPLKSSIYKKHEKNNEILVLWDIENVNFYDDFAIITRLLPKECIKIYSYSKKNHKGVYLKNNDIDFLLNKLRKRKWIEKRTTKIADEVLIKEFNLRKDKLKELYLISSDKDFKEICDNAISNNIKVTILNNNKQRSWFNEENYNYINLNL